MEDTSKDDFKEDEQTNQSSWSWLWNGDECKGIVRNHESDPSEEGTWFFMAPYRMMHYPGDSANDYFDPSQWTEMGGSEYIVDRYGPYDTEEEAKAECEKYIKSMNTPLPTRVNPKTGIREYYRPTDV